MLWYWIPSFLLTLSFPTQPCVNPKTLLVQTGFDKIALVLPSQKIVRENQGQCPNYSRALQAIVDDRSEESLWEVWKSVGHADCNLTCYVNRSSTLLGALETADFTGDLPSPSLPQFAGYFRDYEVFFLQVSDLSEHGYWAFVERAGPKIFVVTEP